MTYNGKRKSKIVGYIKLAKIKHWSKSVLTWLAVKDIVWKFTRICYNIVQNNILTVEYECICGRTQMPLTIGRMIRELGLLEFMSDVDAVDRIIIYRMNVLHFL